jgi:glycosyltransferase A (GT-A) superfamily protein (DUF2064 family)
LKRCQVIAFFQKMPTCLVVLGCLLFGGHGFLTIRRNVAGALFPQLPVLTPSTIFGCSASHC